MTAAERNRVIAEAIGEKGYVECPLCLGAGRLPVDRHFTQRKCSLCNGVGNIRSPIDFASPSGHGTIVEWLGQQSHPLTEDELNSMKAINRSMALTLARDGISRGLMRVGRNGYTYQHFLVDSRDIVARAIVKGKEMEDGDNGKD